MEITAFFFFFFDGRWIGESRGRIGSGEFE